MSRNNLWIILIGFESEGFRDGAWVNEQEEVMLFKTKRDAENEIKKEQIKKNFKWVEVVKTQSLKGLV